jgi:oligoendopeptidase F
MTKDNRIPREKREEKYRWNLEDMYPDEALWKKDYHLALSMAQEMDSYKGQVGSSAQSLLELLQKKDQIWQKAEKVYVYARMRKDENNRNPVYVEMAGQSNVLLSEISTHLSFIVPELIQKDSEIIFNYMKESPDLEVYAHYLHDLFRQKEHVLSPQEERIIALSGQVLHAPSEIFTAFNNADMKFGTIKKPDGQEEELTHGNYIRFMESPDRNLRKEAFEKMYSPYETYQNTLATSYDFTVRTNGVFAKLRNYSGARASSLSHDNIHESVYDNLVEQVHCYLPSLHRYMELRKEVLNLDELKMYDIYVPLFSIPEENISFEDAVSTMLKGLAPLGKEYLDTVAEGIQNRWIDVYEGEGKTSGAYSFGSYDSMPYILMNYNGKRKDIFTLVHEMGHSMHSYYTRKTQPFIYGGHSIFTAEVASTVNEVLLMHYLLDTVNNPTERKALLNLYLEEFRTTLFRQTMFAEFETVCHQASQEGTILTAPWLSETYRELNRKYHGEALGETPLISYEWARIPHFYRSFYVYKYATGYSAAIAIAQGLLQGDKQQQEAYLSFLASGEKDYPIELLRIADVHMDTPDPVQKAMEAFHRLVKELESSL